MATILIADPIDKVGMDILRHTGHDVVESFDIGADELLETILEYDALIVRGRTKVTKEVIERGVKLKIIARAGIGLDTIDTETAKAKGIQVVNAGTATSETVAEHALALMFALARNLVPTASALRAGKWEKKTYHGIELTGKTVGIVGYGSIGMRVAELGAALGMHILVFTRTQPEEKTKHLSGLGGTFVALDELLRTADVVSLHLPLSLETDTLINKEKLALFKSSALLVNTARGAIVDEGALVDALKAGKLAGAALDVFVTEPLPADSPLLTLPNVILTPHVGSVSPEAAERASVAVCQKVNEFFTHLY